MKKIILSAENFGILFIYKSHLKEKNLKFKTSLKIYNKLFWLPSLNLNEKKITLVCNLLIKKLTYRLN